MRRPKTQKAEVSAMEKTNGKRDISKIDKTILDNFYKLVHTQEHVRLKAALSTFKILVAQQKRYPDKFNRHLNYCVERLVTGLASSRALARRGYATLLLEILEHFQFSTDRLLTIGQQKFGNISHESKDNLVAYYLLISVILESGNYRWKTNKDGEYAEKMYKCLLQLKFRKSYFEIPISKLLVRYYEIFKLHMGDDDILERLAEPPVSLLIGINQGQQTQKKLESIFNDCSTEILELYLDKLIKLFGKEHGVEGRKLHSFAAKQMTHLIRRPQMTKQHGPIMKLAKFLIINDLFKYVDPAKLQQNFWNEHDVMPSVEPIGPKTRKSLRTTYHTTLDLIVSTCEAEDRLKFLRELITMVDDLISAGAVKYPESLGNVPQLWTHYMGSLSKHTSLMKKKCNPKILYPITGLYLFYGLQILEHGLECKEQLNDLGQSAKDALKDDPSDGSWADVLTDQIIAILSATECNPWIRRLCVSLFGSLLPHISETSIDLICDVFKMPDEADDESDEDGSDGEVEDGKVVEMDQYSNEVESDGEDDKMDTSISEKDPDSIRKLDDAIKNSFKKDGQQNKDNDDEDEEEEEEEYLDDEQMMKLDSVITDMFKLNRVGKKKKDPSFQLRCLDLVKKIIQKKHSDSELINKVLSVIVPYATKCKRFKELRPITEKINRMIAKAPGRKNLKHQVEA